MAVRARAPLLIEQTAATDGFAGKGWKPRFNIAWDQLVPALHIPDPSLVRGQAISSG